MNGFRIGQKLYDDVTEIYTWYVTSWYMSDGGHPADEPILRTLSLIKRVAEVSMRGGDYLTEKEEARSLAHLSTILNDLNDGSLRKQDFPDALKHALDLLTSSNPKAKVVSQITQLEYRHLIDPPADQSMEETEQYQKLFHRIIEGITPKMREIVASTISRGLTQALEDPDAIKDWV
jgi:hypothetical protein